MKMFILSTLFLLISCSDSNHMRNETSIQLSKWKINLNYLYIHYPHTFQSMGEEKIELIFFLVSDQEIQNVPLQAHLKTVNGNPYIDYWGNSFYINRVDSRIYLHSSGPDEILGNKDDLSELVLDMKKVDLNFSEQSKLGETVTDQADTVSDSQTDIVK